jgi:hypothetical protein
MLGGETKSDGPFVNEPVVGPGNPNGLAGPSEWVQRRAAPSDRRGGMKGEMLK